MSQKTVTVSVRRLVEFILRSGDIDTVSGAFGEMDAMQQGGLMHRKLQKEAGPSYRAEVSLKHTTEMDETLAITVEGRADGVITETEMAADESGELGLKEVVTIDEIKGTYRNLRYITEPVSVHLAQAKCYAFFYAEKEDLEEIQVQMTYVHLKTGKVQRFREKMTRNELEVWYTELIDRFAVWVRHQIAWIKKRNLSIGAGSFPFEYRESQKKLVSGVYQTILRHRRLFVEAPTGTGKTISAIYPAVQAMGNGLSETIFYLTARTIARTVAEDTFGLLQDKGLAMKVITLTAKEKICVLDKVQCSPEYCPRAKGHYDRINEALYDLVTHEDRMTRECILAYADKHQVCPFELQLDAALFADAVIGDYNYVFDPNVALKRFFSDRSGDYLFLIDEAHNLVDRAREMYSAVMSMTELTHARHAVEDKAVDRRLVTYMDRSILAMSALRESSDESCQLMGNIGSLIVYLTKLSEQLEETLPADISLEIIRDDTDSIRETIRTLVESAAEGLVLAVLILFIFLQNFKSTIIISISIPLSIVITLLSMSFAGITLNMMTLTGLILGVGMIVDASIVMIDNIYEYRSRGARARIAAVLGSQEMVMSVISGNLTTICVFVPFLLYIKELGMMGQMFKGIIFTIVIALLSSLLVAIFLVPVLAGVFLPLSNRAEKPVTNKILLFIYGNFEKAIAAVTRVYKKLLKSALSNRAITLVIACCLLVIAIALNENDAPEKSEK